MKSIVFVLTLCLSTVCLLGQNISAEYSPEIQYSTNETPDQLLHIADQDLLISTTIAGQEKHLFYDFLDVENPYPFDAEFPFKTGRPVEFVTRQGRLFRFLMQIDQETKMLERCLAEYTNDGKVMGAKKYSSVEYEDVEDLPIQVLYESPDSTYVCLVDITDNDEKKKKYKLHITLLDENMKVVRSYDYGEEEESEQKLYDLITARVNNDGDIYLLQKVYNRKLKEATKKDGLIIANYNYEVLKFDLDTLTDSGRTTIYPLDNQGKFATSQQLFLKSDGGPLVVSTINASEDRKSRMMGINSYAMENDSFSTKEFIYSDKLLRTWGFDKNEIKYGLRNFYNINYDFVMDDDQIHILMERQLSLTRNQVYNNTYLSGLARTAIVATLDNDGAVTANMFVPKNFELSGGEAPASKLVALDGELYLIYQDKKASLKARSLA